MPTSSKKSTALCRIGGASFAALVLAGCSLSSGAPAQGLVTALRSPTAAQYEIADETSAEHADAREPDDETALSASPAEPPEPIMSFPTTGHLVLGDDTDRYRRTFGEAPRLLTPWDITLAELPVGRANMLFVGRYADLEPMTGPAVTRHPGQHRSLIIAFQPQSPLMLSAEE